MEKLLAIQTELKAPKDLKNTFGGYHYRSCESILEALKPLLLKHKLVLTLKDDMVSVGSRIYVKAIATLFDNGKVLAEITAFAREEETKKGMDASQITGACASYARKYALNGLFLIDDAKDSDSTNTHDKATDDLAEKAAMAKARYNAGLAPKEAAMAQMAPKPVKPQPTAAQGLAEGHYGVRAIVLYGEEPNKGGYRKYAVEGQQSPNGKDIKFSTKDPNHISILANCIEKGIKAHIEYVISDYNGFQNFNIVDVHLDYKAHIEPAIVEREEEVPF